jgi:Fe-S oxidoreductase
VNGFAAEQAEVGVGEEVIIIDDDRWEKLVELTHGAATTCFQCGVCTAVCPWGLVREETVSVRSLMRLAQLGLLDESSDVWLCTTCGHCEANCPRGVHIGEVILGLRYLLWESRQTPSGLPSLLWSVFWNNNPWAQPPSQRSQWAKDLDLPLFDPDQHEILLYIGCTTSYDRRSQQVGQALVHLLKAAGVPFGFLGDDEPCCGEAALSVGHKPYFQEVARETAKVFTNRGVSQLVTVSPHCYDVFKNHYPQVEGIAVDSIMPTHYTDYLAQLVEDGRLPLERSVHLKVTFHDPCFLARHNDETVGPRRVLGAIPGLELTEMEHAGSETLCCGGGGGRMWLETVPGERFADIRVQEALATGASVLSTACPFCIACLEDSLKAQKISNLVVMDVAELAELTINKIDNGDAYLQSKKKKKFIHIARP